MYLNLTIIVAEVLFITLLNYQVAASYISLDVLYCLPIIQAASIKALRAERQFDTQLPLMIGIFTALIWSLAEMLVAQDDYSLGVFLLNTFTRAVTLTVIGRLVSRLWKERSYGYQDYLSNLSGRMEFMEKFAYEQLRSERSRKPYSLLFIDINNFRRLLDSHGKQIGDEALGHIAEILRRCSRRVDSIGRIGDEEFIMLFPETNERGCEVLRQRILEQTEAEFRQRGWDISLSIDHITQTGLAMNVTEAVNTAEAVMSIKKKARDAAGN